MGMKKLAALVMALVLCLTAVSAMAEIYHVDDDTEFSAAVDNLKDGDIIQLDGSFTTNKKIITNKEFTLDLNTHKLTFNSYNHVFNSGANIIFKNGSIHLDATANGQGFFSVRGAELELNGVKVTGDGIGSAYGVFLIENGSTFDVVDCDIDILNDTAATGGVIKVNNGGSSAETINIKNSTITYTSKASEAVGILTDSNSEVNVENTAIEISGTSSGINVLGEFNTKESTITISDCSERGIKIYAQGNIVAENSKIVLDASFRFATTPKDNQITLKNTSFNVKKIEDNDGNAFPAVAEIIEKAFEFEGMALTIGANGNIVIASAPTVNVNTDSLPQTGDNSSLMLWASMLALAAAGFVASRKTRLN